MIEYPLQDFDFSVLNNLEFGEDAAREEILFPIIKALGYKSTGSNKIIRSRKLEHPFVTIGTRAERLTIIPDYVLEVDNKPKWIMEAKSPQNDITKKDIEQAYSYAFHREINAQYYVLCNGRDFILYTMSDIKPLVACKVNELQQFWNIIYEHLSPIAFRIKEKTLNTSNFKTDLGLHYFKLCFDKIDSIFFYEIPLDHISKIEMNLYSFTLDTMIDGKAYCATFDFSQELFMQLERVLPRESFAFLLSSTKPIIINEIPQFSVSIECSIDRDIQVKPVDPFIPFKIKQFI